MKKPKIFISYAWEDDVKNWVKNFSQKLENEGIEVYIDQNLQLGDRLPQFMEEITSVDYVLIICTPIYKEKADSRKGGVGYEGHIISATLMTSSNERKFIPILYKGTFDESLPNFLLGKYSVDLSATNPNYTKEYNKLVTTLRGKKSKSPRQVQNAPQDSKKISSNIEDDNNANEAIRILKILTDEVTTPKMDGTRGSALYKIPFKLSRKPSKLWSELFVQVWNAPPHCTSMHRPGIASVIGDKIILDGTTMAEVKQYHKDTLNLCIDEANKKERELVEKIQKQKIIEQQKKEIHFKNVTKIADEIQF